MPELPEVEILVRHLDPLLRNRVIRSVDVRREKILRPTSPAEFARRATGAKILSVARRAKYLLFALRPPGGKEADLLIGHLGMTGRIYLAPRDRPLPRHAAVVFDLGLHYCVFEDTRYFGRMTFDTAPLAELGPEPLEPGLRAEVLWQGLRRSRQAIKVKLLDQSLLAGIGNIYASESLFVAGIAPCRRADRLKIDEVSILLRAIRKVLREAIAAGSTVPLDFAGAEGRDGLFYYGSSGPGRYEERLRVYDRLGQPCLRCRAPIRRTVQAGRSTYFCPRCQCGLRVRAGSTGNTSRDR